jgi:hypothetical protein
MLFKNPHIQARYHNIQKQIKKGELCIEIMPNQRAN